MAEHEDQDTQAGHLSPGYRADESTAEGKPSETGGELSRLSLDKAAKKLYRMWRDQDSIKKRQAVQWKCNVLRRAGVVGVRITKDRDSKTFKVWAPPGAAATLPTMNRAARLCRRLTANFFVDPPIPEATPSTDTDEDRAAAEFSTRVLIDVGGEAGIDDVGTAMEAFDLANEYGSGFRWYYVDPEAGGNKPMAIEASGAAESVRLDDDGLPIIEDGIQDPVTGTTYPEPYRTRFVRADGTLTDDEYEEDVLMQWRPALQCEVLNGHNVRPIPAMARDVWAAKGMMIGRVVPFGQVAAQFPQLRELSKEQKAAVFEGVGEQGKDLLPPHLRQEDLGALEDENEQPVFVLTAYLKQSADYPHGLYLVAVGDGVGLHRDTWENPRTGEMLDIPIDQIRQMNRHGDFNGYGMMENLGPGNEILATAWGALLEHLDRFNRRRWFLPLNSTLQPKELTASTAAVLYTNPGGEPKAEDVPDFPPAAEKMTGMIREEMNDESSLQEVGQGLNTPSVESGLHAQRIIEQVQAGLTDMRLNLTKGLTRGWRIQLQLIRAFYDIPQLTSWVGEDGQYKVKEWTGTDLGSTRDVRLNRGSFTGMTPTAKAALAQTLAELGLLTPLELERTVIGSVGGMLGLQDNPHWQRIRRQVARWKEGPGEEALAAAKMYRQAAMRGQMTGQPFDGKDPLMLAAAEIWLPNPADTDPDVAPVRHAELVRLLSSSAFERFPEGWKQPVVQAYETARQAAGKLTAAEQAKAQQSAAEAEAAAMKAEAAAKGEQDRQTEQVKIQGRLAEKKLDKQPRVSVNVSARAGEPGDSPLPGDLDTQAQEVA